MAKRSASLGPQLSEFWHRAACAILACLAICSPKASPIVADEGSAAPPAQGSSAETSKYISLSGSVKTPDGKVAAGMEIVAQSVGQDGKRTSSKATTGSDGSYSIIVRRSQACVIGVVDRDWAAEPRVVEVPEDHPAEPIDFTLSVGALFKGVVQGAKESPLPNQMILVQSLGREATGKADNIHFQ